MQSQIFEIVFEDSEFLVIEKLVPFLSQKADNSDKESLPDFLERTLKKKIFPIHRLDREVLGLMVFAYTKRACDQISEQFKNRNIEKKYEAIVKGRVSKDRDTLIHYLKKNPKNNHVTVFPRETEGAKKAQLTYEVLERGDGWTRLLIDLHTGRTHQIRVQLSKIGHPLWGDHRYNEHTNSDEEVAIRLRSVFLSFAHPTTKEQMSFSSAYHLSNPHK